MTKILPVLTLLLWATALSAQITITADDTPEFGRFLVSATDTTITELSIGEPSAQPQEWSFLELDQHSRSENTVVDPATTPGAADFPDATFTFVTADSQYAYAQVTDTALLALGGTAAVLPGFPPLTAAFDNPQLLLTAPATYGTAFNDIYRIAVTVAGSDFGVDADSVRFVRTAAIQAEVDAFGTLSVPAGTYDVLRLRTEVLTVDSISIKLFGTFFPVPGTPIVSETVSYEWWGKDGVGIVMSVDEDEEGVLSEATYLIHSSDMPVGPEAAFSAAVGAEGLTGFDNMSSGSASSFAWDFGDGTASTEVNPEHTYAQQGIYTVCLTAINSVGEDITCEEVIVALAPQAAFTSEVMDDGSVLFTDLSTNDPTGWSWDFGDGNSSDEQNPEHTYAESGTYTVCLTASNGAGSDESCEEVDVSIVSVGQADPQAAQLIIFPSPASGPARLMLKGLEGERLSLHCFDALGRQVWQQQLQSAPAVVELPAQRLSPGLYRLMARFADGQRVVTFSVQ